MKLFKYYNKNGLPKLKDSATLNNIYESTCKFTKEIQDQDQKQN